VCPLRRQSHNTRGGYNSNNRYLKRKPTNECETSAGAGYAERAESQRWNEQAHRAPTYEEQEEVAYVRYPQMSGCEEIQENQLAYLQSMCRAANRCPTRQRVPKRGGQAVDNVAVTFEPTSFNISEVNKLCDHGAWFEKLEVNGRRARAKVDTGARVNVLSKHHLHLLGYALSDLRCSNVILVSFNQALVCPLGCITLSVRIRGWNIPMRYHVVEECAKILISYRDAVWASLIPESTCGECSEPLIETLSTYNGEVIHLQLDENASPKNFPPRKVPLAMESEVKAELKCMVDKGVIIEE
jgi:hypothetical protein